MHMHMMRGLRSELGAVCAAARAYELDRVHVAATFCERDELATDVLAVGRHFGIALYARDYAR